MWNQVLLPWLYLRFFISKFIKRKWKRQSLSPTWLLVKVKVLVAQSCLTLCNPMDCSPPGSSVHGILQARILESAAIPFSRGSSRPRDQTQVSHIAGRFFTTRAHQRSLQSLLVVSIINSMLQAQTGNFVRCPWNSALGGTGTHFIGPETYVKCTKDQILKKKIYNLYKYGNTLKCS